VNRPLLHSQRSTLNSHPSVFRRLAFENSAALFTIVAFVTASSIYVTFAWRALRMKRPQLDRFENLPFDTPTPAVGCEPSSVAIGKPQPAGQRAPS
jgi:hypothetical protein